MGAGEPFETAGALWCLVAALLFVIILSALPFVRATIPIQSFLARTEVLPHKDTLVDALSRIGHFDHGALLSEHLLKGCLVAHGLE